MQELLFEACQAGAEVKSTAVMETVSMVTAWASQRSAMRMPGLVSLLTTWKVCEGAVEAPSEAG